MNKSSIYEEIKDDLNISFNVFVMLIDDKYWNNSIQFANTNFTTNEQKITYICKDLVQLFKNNMYVRKKNGTYQFTKKYKIEQRIKYLANGFDEGVHIGKKLDIDINFLVDKIFDNINNGITTCEIDKYSAKVSQNQVLTHPDYQILAGRIIISNMHKYTYNSFEQTERELIKKGILNSKLTKILDMYGKYLDDILDYKKDFYIPYMGYLTLKKLYSVNGIERPQHVFLRYILQIHYNSINLEHFDICSLSKVHQSYYYISQGYFTHASPTIFNSFKMNCQLASCFLLDVEDSTEGITIALSRCCNISKLGGGVGLSINKLRGDGASIVGTHGTSGGPIPFLRVFNDCFRAWNQSGRRPGSCTVYMEPWHKNYPEFLELRDNNGDENMRARDLFTATWFPDIFFKRLKESMMENRTVLWSFFCPGKYPKLANTYGDEFEKYYIQYEKEAGYEKQIPIQDLFIHMISVKILETGAPFACSKDNANNHNMQKNIGMIRSSNLCTEIYEVAKTDPVYLAAVKDGGCEIPVSNGEIANCNLASVCLNKFVKYNVDDKIYYFDYNELYDVVQIIADNLNQVIDITTYSSKDTYNSNMKARPMAIGVQGFADVLSKMHLSYEDEETKILNHDIFETIYFSALTKSNQLSKKYGPYHYFKGSPYEKGQLHFDFYDDTYLSGKWDWDGLRKNIIKYGVRNSLMVACMPTASSAQLYGNTESFEPRTYNVYTRKVLSGTYVITNTFMQRELIKLGLWTSELRRKLILNSGSIQNIDEIPKDIKYRYKTVWEIPHKCRIDLLGVSQQFVDQGLSFNFYLINPTPHKLASMWLYMWGKKIKTLNYYCRIQTNTKAHQFTVTPEDITPQKKYNFERWNEYDSDNSYDSDDSDIYEEPYIYENKLDNYDDIQELNNYYNMIHKMNDIVVYTKQNCKFCIKAKKLLNENKMKFGEISLDNDDTCNEFFKYLRCNLSNKKDIPKTVPQIFIKGVRIGGFTYLYERLSVKNTENKSIMITNNENQLLDNLQAEFESECVSCQA